jgi:preprotein translocase subunit SecG
MTFLSILIGVFTFALILTSLFLVLIVLMQKSKDGGVGAAMGGGMAEAAFGADTGNVLSKSTINAAIAFFVISFGLYLAQVYQHKHVGTSTDALPTIVAPAAPASAAPAAPAPAAAQPAVPAPANK